MKTFFRKRRNKQLPAEKNYKIITFRLRQLQQLWFGFPLHKVLKIIIGKQLYYDSRQPQLMMTEYQGQEIFVINVDKYIFNKKSNNFPPIKNKHLLLFKNHDKEDIIALPIDSQPQILDVKKSELKPLPSKCSEIGNITLLSNKIVKRENHPVYIIFSPSKIILHKG